MSFVSLGIFNHIVPNDIFEKIQKGGYMFEIAKTKMIIKIGTMVKFMIL
jgi:hypothetical protein